MSTPSPSFDYIGHLKYLSQRFTQPSSVYDFAMLCNIFILACVSKQTWSTDEEVEVVEVLHNCIFGFSTHVEKTVVSLWSLLWPHDATADYAYGLIHKLLDIAVQRIAPCQDHDLKLRLQYLVWSMCNTENPALPSLFHFSCLDEFVGTDAGAEACLVQRKNAVGGEVAEAHEGLLTASGDAIPSTARPVESTDVPMADAKVLENPRDEEEMPEAKRIKLDPAVCFSPESLFNLSPLTSLGDSAPSSPHIDTRTETTAVPSTPPPRHAKPPSPFFRSPYSRSTASRDSTPSPSRPPSPQRSPARLTSHNLPRTQRKQLRRTPRGMRHATRTIITRSQAYDKENIAAL